MFPQKKFYIPINRTKYVGDINSIIMRSSWERKFAYWCDTNPNVLKWGSEIKAIPYIYSIDGTHHNYFPDFWVSALDSENKTKLLLVEIKPGSQVNKPRRSKNKTEQQYLTEVLTWVKNQDKWKAAELWSKQNGWQFVVLTEKELGIKYV